jgi:lipopolysaccharide export system protein LptA
MRWQSVLRFVIAAAGIGVAVVVYQNLRERPVDDTGGGVATLADPNALVETEAIEGGPLDDLKIMGEDGKPAIVLSYKKSKLFADGRKEFDDVRATFVRSGAKNTISAKRAVATGKAGPTGEQPAVIVFTGAVNLTSEDGISVEAEDEATFYNIEQKTVIPGRMSFTRGRLSGSGVGADLYMDRSVLWINNEAKLSVAPEFGEGDPVEASATKIGLADAEHYMVLEENAVMTHHSQRLSATNARVSFTETGDVVQFIELRGRSRVASTGSAASKPNLTAENINLTFAPHTGLLTHTKLVQSAVVELRESAGVTRIKGADIDIYVGADGETITRLQATDPVEVTLPQQSAQPAKVITAASLNADGDETRGLTRAVFEGRVSYSESRAASRGQAALSRVATSETLELGLKGDLAQVDTAVFRRNFRVKDGELVASAAEGTYDSTKETLRLRSPGTGTPRPKVTNGEMDVTAREIDADMKADGFVAVGRVDSFLTPSSKTKTPSAGGLFEPGKQITGVSERLKYQSDAGTAVYEGSVFLVQADSSLRADRVDIDDVKSDLVAKGNVISKLAMDIGSAPANAKDGGTQKPSEISAGHLVYTDAARTAVYSGGAKLDTPTGETLMGEQVTLTLEPGDRKLKTAVAVASAGGQVVIRLLEQRQAQGTRATFTAATDTYKVLGSLAAFVMPDPERRPGECNVVSGSELEFKRTEGGAGVKTEGGALGRGRSAKCADVMKVIK